MEIKTLKKFKWGFEGCIKSFEAFRAFDIDDMHAQKMIDAGYAEKMIEKAENKMLDIDYENKKTNQSSKKSNKKNKVKRNDG